MAIDNIQAVNDIVIDREPSISTVSLKMYVNGKFITFASGDGYIHI